MNSLFRTQIWEFPIAVSNGSVHSAHHSDAGSGFFASVPDIISTTCGGANSDGAACTTFFLVFAGHCVRRVDGHTNDEDPLPAHRAQDVRHRLDKVAELADTELVQEVVLPFASPHGGPPVGQLLARFREVRLNGVHRNAQCDRQHLVPNVVRTVAQGEELHGAAAVLLEQPELLHKVLKQLGQVGGAVKLSGHIGDERLPPDLRQGLVTERRVRDHTVEAFALSRGADYVEVPRVGDPLEVVAGLGAKRP